MTQPRIEPQSLGALTNTLLIRPMARKNSPGPDTSRIDRSIALSRFGGWYYLPTPPLGQDMTQGQFLSGV